MTALITKFIDTPMSASGLRDDLKVFRDYCLDEIFTNHHKKLEKLFKSKNVTFKILKREPFTIDLKNLKISNEFRKHVTNKGRENYIEIINQMANIEGMILVLGKWPKETVKIAHPTHTSSPKQKGDHDLVLKRSDNKLVRYIEISDVISEKKDSNGKFEKDLSSLYKTFSENTDKENKSAYYYIVTSTSLWNYHKSSRLTIRKKTYKFYFNISTLEPQSNKPILKICNKFTNDGDFFEARPTIYKDANIAIIRISFIKRKE